MATFNFNRFVNFGKYDFAINKAFYRNTSLLTIFIALGIELIGFVCRYLSFSSCAIPVEEAVKSGFDNFMINPQITLFTDILLLIYMTMMSIILAGHAFHNLRNKQGRIMELTMPATNLERYLWHVLVVAVLGSILICLSIVCADAFNALLNLIVYQGKVSSSLTKDVFGILSATYEPIAEGFKELDQGLFHYRLIIVNGLINSIALYIFGNAIKYKYNIILTYISLYIIQTVLVIAAFSITCATIDINDGNTSMYVAQHFIQSTSYILNTITAIITVLCFWGSYKLYCKAQITSRRNK